MQFTNDSLSRRLKMKENIDDILNIRDILILRIPLYQPLNLMLDINC